MCKYQRHDLVWLNKTLSRPQNEILNYWLQAGFPLVVTSQLQPITSTLRVGLALPGLKSIKTRLAFVIPVEWIEYSRPPLHSAYVLPLLPEPLLTENESQQIHVYGSYAWQVLTGLSYVTATSDLDCQICVSSLEDPLVQHTFLKKLLQYPFLRIEGELCVAGTLSINWREWMGNTDKILVKTLTEKRLLSKKDLLSAKNAGFYT